MKTYKIDTNDIQNIKNLMAKYYIEGLYWVFQYYYNGCASCSWFYPFHYAPFSSDLIDLIIDLKNTEIIFDKSEPFLPFEQLLSVLPPYSAEALPECLRKLMTDPESPIADFYPENIKLDINNETYLYKGINLLPFIDEKRIKIMLKIF